MDCTSIKVGDYVWTGSGLKQSRESLECVARITPTQIIMEGFKRRFCRLDGRPFGVHYFGARWILSVATTSQIAKWNADQQAGKEAAAALQLKKDNSEQYRRSLQALLPEGVYLAKIDNDGETYYEIIHLTEDQVRKIGSALTA